MDVLISPRTGLSLKNPVIAASGTFGYGTESAARIDISGLGAIVCKGTTLEPRPGNEPLRLTETSAGMLNSIGLQNIGVDAVVREKAPIWARWDLPVLVNVSGSCVDDYVEVVSRLEGVPGISGIELNVSCPNVKEGGLAFGTDASSAGDVTRAVRAATKLPLMVKLSPNVTDIHPIAEAVVEAGADAVSLINTVYGLTIDRGRRRDALTPVVGGLSGPAIKPYALFLVWVVARTVSVPVIGIGGIMSAQDALDYIFVGATAVQIGTALMVDPLCWRQIVADLDEWCRREGVRSLDEVRGAANPDYMRRAGEASLAGSR